ncbi:MAG: TIGR03790 family protein [Chthoniobacterales bacterium]
MCRLILAALILVMPWAIRASPESDATIVLYNRNDPSSRSLAKHYAEVRDIPFSQVLGLNTSTGETIDRDEYLVTIEAPLRNAFTQRGWWTIERGPDGERFVSSANKRFVAIIRGVPLRVRSDARESTEVPGEIKPGSPIATLFKHNEASVDSELSAIFSLLDTYPAILQNPYYRRLTPILGQPPKTTPLLVCRLDGPTPEIVRQMIDDAIATENSGLWGWAYVDARNITSGAYKEGDDWLIEVGRTMRQRGIPVIYDNDPEVFPVGYPITDAAVYYGWYTANVAGALKDPAFRFLPGAVACHLHSGSASTLRKPNKHWSAPLLARGATATVGNVFEPYLSLTSNFDILQDRLMAGLTLAEAGYASMRALSWMGVILGDPLYRPYAQWIDNPGGPADNNWKKYRNAVLAAGDNAVFAAEELAKLAEQTGDSMFLEALGQAYAAEGQTNRAVTAFDQAFAMEKRTPVRFRITLAKIAILEASGDTAAARSALGQALGDFASPEQVSILDRIALRINEPAPRDS